MRFIPPLRIRKLRAEMALKALRVGDVAEAAEVHISKASEVLSGKRIDPEALRKLTRVIKATPLPTEAVA